MGQRITIDSASMFNKSAGTHRDARVLRRAARRIEVLVHPQSLVHALVGFNDGALMAHVGPADMRHAIGYALNWPERRALPVARNRPRRRRSRARIPCPTRCAGRRCASRAR
ncbi:MAG: hypothetical protein R3D59_17740 [Paracoccaceae bacterium]